MLLGKDTDKKPFGPVVQSVKMTASSLEVITGPVAQLARASALHAEGQGFESPRVHSSLTIRIRIKF